MTSNIFTEVAVVLLTSGVLAMVAHKLRQPLIMAYIFTGIIVGPGLLGWVSSLEFFEMFSTFGISLLLFIVGLNLDWREIKNSGGVALAAGFAQVVVTSLVGWGIAMLLGFSTVTAGFMAVTFSLSSTIVIIKLLSDKEDIDRLYGRITVGILVVQDLIAMMLLLLLSTYIQGGSWQEVLTTTLLKGVVTLVGLFLVSKYIVPSLFRYAAQSSELLFLIALVWCFAGATAFQMLGFGLEIGALLAGVTLAGTGFQHEIEGKIRMLRDFFIIVFFIVLGTNLQTGNIAALILPGVAMSAFVLIGNPVLTFLIMRLMGHHPRTGFLTGVSLAQISEFSFILLGIGVGAGLVDAVAIPLATIVGLSTIALSSYLIAFNDRLYEWLTRHVRGFGSEVEEAETIAEGAPDVVLIGYDRMGTRILPMVTKLARRHLIIDFDPTVVEELEHAGEPVMYGDAGNDEVLKRAQVHRSRLVVSTIPDMAVNADMLDFLHGQEFKGSVIVTAKSSADAGRCYELGATFVIVPSILGGELFAKLLKSNKLAKTSWKKLAKEEIIAA